ncbi:PREDICTED: putative protein TPRXL [Acropora digitifera]|uniref:putative protein TPRXL n=1 Tax=Acropora digitifera TaxID=70779 RepID=UPI00077B09AA|nr:PREDICTED: putative protein TPRXL [Acropora digitifera]
MLNLCIWLVDGKISTARKKRSRKLTRGKTTEPFIDYSITKPCLGISPYSKTDPNGEEQRKLEEKRQQTQLEQQRQHEHQEQIRDENNKMSASTVPAKTTSTSSNQANVASTLTAPTTSSTMTSATENVNKTSSTGTTELSAPRSQFTGPTDNANAGPTTGGGKETSVSVESSNSVTPNDSQSKSSSEGSSHATPPSSLGQQSTATVSKCGNVSCIGCCNCGNSSLSAIQASHARKKTNAGLVITKDRLQRSSGVEVIDLEGDGTAGLVSVSMETDHILDSLTSQKNEVGLFGLVARRSLFLRGRGRLSCAWLCSEDLLFKLMPFTCDCKYCVYYAKGHQTKTPFICTYIPKMICRIFTGFNNLSSIAWRCS